MASKPRTLYEKIFDAHVIERRDDGTCLIFIDRHLVHEVTSPQAFEALRMKGRTVRHPELTLAVPDHNLPTSPRLDAGGERIPIADKESADQLAALERNAPEFGVRYFDATSSQQGIVHVVGPEQGFSLPGTTIVCGDSHTACHGGLGAWAFGIGTSEVEHVLATQTLLLRPSKTMEVRVEGELGLGITAKDLIMHIIGVVGTAGGTGHVIEYRGKVFEQMSVESRLTVCNMSIEAGARGGLIAPDETTFDYIKGRPFAPGADEWDDAVAYWKTLYTDPDAEFDRSVVIDAAEVEPSVTWGTSPEDVVAIGGTVPAPETFADPSKQEAARASLEYMTAVIRDERPTLARNRVDLTALKRTALDAVFNSNIEMPAGTVSPVKLTQALDKLLPTDAIVTAVRLAFDTDGFTYRRYGGDQRCKRGDWIVHDGGEPHTVDHESFVRTYEEVSPGRYLKTAPVWAEVATQDGEVGTLEGVTR